MIENVKALMDSVDESKIEELGEFVCDALKNEKTSGMYDDFNFKP